MWLNICRRNVKYDRFVAIWCVFSSSKYSKTRRFRPGLHPRPHCDAPADRLVDWGGPHSFPPRRLGISISVPSAPQLSAPPNTNSWLHLCAHLPPIQHSQPTESKTLHALCNYSVCVIKCFDGISCCACCSLSWQHTEHCLECLLYIKYVNGWRRQPLRTHQKLRRKNSWTA